jgi:(R,R)-butanediol dehydrogenase/meso-butanediol dehydrogenase/diacetyl reductase
MRAAVLIQPGEIQIEERPRLEPLPGEVEIEVKWVAICGSDLARFEGRFPFPGSSVFGHEFAGVVESVGSDVDGFHQGELVTVAPLLNCGRCRYCRLDKGYLCSERVKFGTQVDGALREHLTIRADRVYTLPKENPLEWGALTEPLAVAVHAVRQAGSLEGAQVAIMGAGAIGLLIAEIAHVSGAIDIMVADIDRTRVQLAEQLGYVGIHAQDTSVVSGVLARTEGRGAEVVFEATGSYAAAIEMFPMLAKLGRMVIVGLIKEPVPIGLDQLLMKEGQLVTSRYFSLADFRRAVDLIALGNVNMAALIQAKMPFDRFREEKGRIVMQAARKAVRLLVEIG